MYDKRRIRGREVVDDIRSGMTSSELMNKYKLSPAGLRKIFRKLVETKSMSRDELEEHSGLYSDMEDVKGLRRWPRKRLSLPLPIYDGGDPFKGGRVTDVSETGVCVEGIAADVGEMKTFIVRPGGSSRASFVFEGMCRWVHHNPDSSIKWVAGFKITSISNLDLEQFRRLLGWGPKPPEEVTDFTAYHDKPPRQG